MTRLITPVELRGLEPLTPTLPGPGRNREQARCSRFASVGVVVEGAIVVTVVVKIVVSQTASLSTPARALSAPGGSSCAVVLQSRPDRYCASAYPDHGVEALVLRRINRLSVVKRGTA
jgi:hypothetical protein